MGEEKKLNCWEFKKCGRERGGARAAELGICGAYLEARLHGENSGVSAGRACWVVAGTLCQGKVQGSFAQKFDTCEKCDFYNVVRQEEYPRFRLSSTLRAKLRDQ